jgi:hypothetical protein
MLEDIGRFVFVNDEDRNQCCHREVVRSCSEMMMRSKQVYKVMSRSS